VRIFLTFQTHSSKFVIHTIAFFWHIIKQESIANKIASPGIHVRLKVYLSSKNIAKTCEPYIYTSTREGTRNENAP